MEFNFDEYPVLMSMLEGHEFFKVCIGPAGCVPADTQVMTRQGWVAFADLTSAQAQAGALVYDPTTQEARFEATTRVCHLSTGFLHFKSEGGWALDMRVSKEHKVWAKTRYLTAANPQGWYVRSAQALARRVNAGRAVQANVPAVFGVPTVTGWTRQDQADAAVMTLIVLLRARRQGVHITDTTATMHGLSENRVGVMADIVAMAPDDLCLVPQDGHEPGSVILTGRGVNRHAEQAGATSQVLWAIVHANHAVIPLVAQWLRQWYTTPRSRVYGLSIRVACPIVADVVQYLFTAAGQAARLGAEETAVGHSPAPGTPGAKTYRVTVGNTTRGNWPDMRGVSHVPHIPPAPGELMYCLTTSTGMFVMRQNGGILCTGNSAKTTGAVAMALRDAMVQKPDSRGYRLTRTVVVRQTYTQLAGNTAKSIRALLGGIGGEVTEGKPPKGTLELPLPDGTTMRWELQFLALDAPNVEADIRGLDVTNGILDELSSAEDEEVVLALLSRLGRYPSPLLVAGGATTVQAWGVTNGPTKGTWLHRWWLGGMDAKFQIIEDQIAKETGRTQKFFGRYQQPPALLMQPDGTHLPNPLAENVRNLPNTYGYYYLQLARDPAAVQAFVYGEFADLEVGTRVYKAFGAIHTLPQAKFMSLWQGSRVMMQTYDFGRTPVCLFAVERATGGLIVFDEVMAEDISIDNFVQNFVIPTMQRRYPGVELEFATGDPSGLDKSGVVDLSPFAVLHRHSIPIELPGGTRVDDLGKRIEATRNRLTTLDHTGVPMLQVTDNCKYLIEALSQTYIYKEVVRGGGSISEAPTKSHKNWTSDLANALEYLCRHKAPDLERADPFGDIARQVTPMVASRPMLGG